MKLVCINNKNNEKYLTIGKIYKTNDYNKYKTYIKVISDNNYIIICSKILFISFDKYKNKK